MQQRERLRALRVAAVDEDDGGEGVGEREAAKLRHAEGAVRVVADDPVDGNGDAGGLDPVLEQPERLGGAPAGPRPVGVEPEKATRVVGEPLGGLGGERLAPVGPDVGDGGEALVGEVPPHPPLPVEHGVHRVEEPWARVFCRGVADGPEVGDLEAVVRPLSCEEVPYAHVDLACKVPQLPHRRLPRAIEPLGELWEGLRDLPVREAAAASRPFEHLGFKVAIVASPQADGLSEHVQRGVQSWISYHVTLALPGTAS